MHNTFWGKQVESGSFEIKNFTPSRACGGFVFFVVQCDGRLPMIKGRKGSKRAKKNAILRLVGAALFWRRFAYAVASCLLFSRIFRRSFARAVASAHFRRLWRYAEEFPQLRGNPAE